MPLQFVKSQKGKDLLVYHGHMFSKEKTDENRKIIWKCLSYAKSKCSARIHTMDDGVIKEPHDHNHAPDQAKVQVKNVISGMKDRAETAPETSTHQIVAASVVNLGVAVQGQLPSVPCLKRTVQRLRQQVNEAPPNPLSLEDLQIPNRYQLTDTGAQFLIWDSGPGPDRILMWSTEQNLDLLARSHHWYADGTFKTAPPLFQQLYTIHGVHYHNVVPTVFALLPNKTEETYTRLLTDLKNRRPALNPETVMTDFELASINAFQNQFPNVANRGCFFHLGQCVWRRVQALGLQGTYETDPAFALKVRMIWSLAYVPIPDVVNAFEVLSENVPLEMQPILDYFEDTWIGRERRGRRGIPLFPIPLWNCFAAAVGGLPKTNNGVEGWHRGFSELVGAPHPTIFKFITCLKKEQSMNEMKIEQYIAGQEPPPGRLRYRDCAKRILQIVNDYANREIMDYLRGLAHNYNF